MRFVTTFLLGATFAILLAAGWYTLEKRQLRKQVEDLNTQMEKLRLQARSCEDRHLARLAMVDELATKLKPTEAPRAAASQSSSAETSSAPTDRAPTPASHSWLRSPQRNKENDIFSASVAAHSRTAVREALRLSSDQTRDMDAAIADMNKSLDELFSNLQWRPSDELLPYVQASAEALKIIDATDKKFRSSLNPEQLGQLGSTGFDMMYQLTHQSALMQLLPVRLYAKQDE